jgi:tRNA threonylcarbamoyladenosine biosynthesis protein TsaB
MKILSIDTAHGVCSVALAENGKVIALKNEHEQARQAESLFIIIADILKENNVTYGDVGAVAVNIGPGSFTGVRIGMAAARGIALAAKIPVIGVTGFEALMAASLSLENVENLLIAFDARRGQVYAKFYQNQSGGEELLLDYQDVISLVEGRGGFHIAGDAASLLEPYLQENKLNYQIISGLQLPDAAIAAPVAFEKINSGNYSANPAPLYIRPPDAKLPKQVLL